MRRLAVLAALLPLTGCGGHAQSHESRDAVRAYIAHVNAIELALNEQLAAVSHATVTFSKARDMRTATPALARAQRTFHRLHAQLEQVTPPAQARRLHRLLLSLVAREEALAEELRTLSMFGPAFADALQPLTAANAAARTALRSATDPGVIAAAVHRYRAAVGAAADRVRALRPPAVERPLYEAQLQRLAALGSALGRLERAVNARDRTAVAKAEHGLSVASVSSDTRARQVAERDAVLTYNARVASLNSLAARVQHERDRLQRALP